MQNEEIEAASVYPTATELPQPLVSARWQVLLALFNWAGSIAFSLLIPLALSLVYAGLFAPQILQELLLKKQLTLTRPLVLSQLIGLFLAQLFSLLLSWIIVRGQSQESFAAAMGLQWGNRFHLPHALMLGVGMFVLSLGLARLLPQHETDLDMLLKFGLPVRICLALVATIGAPIQEELVYRGVLYTALERAIGMRSAVIAVSLLFWLVHIPQYWKSPATWVAVLVLSFVLTSLRAWTGKLLPCIATHLFFNGIQGVLLVLVSDPAPAPVPQPAWLFGWSALGW